MKSNVQLILVVVYSTVNIFCDGSQFVQKRLTWMEANKFCKDQNSTLACIKPEDISNTDLQDVQNFWIATHTTFSSWIKDDGYLLGDPIGEEFVIPEDDIYTCQLLCTRYTHFAVKATKCQCFSGDSNTQATGTVKAYESVEESQLSFHLVPSHRLLKKPCDYYICEDMFSSPFQKPNGISNDCFSTDRFLVICSSLEIQHHQQQQCQSLKDYRNQIRYGNVECKLYRVDYIYDNAVCWGTGNGVGNGCFVAVQTFPNFVKGVGLTSSVNQDKMNFSCYFGTLSAHNDIQNMTFSESIDCNVHYNFFCERDFQNFGLCNMTTMSTRKSTNHTSSTSTTTGIAIGVSVSICIIVLILVGLLILIYCIRNKAKISRQNHSSNGSSFRNIAYEPNPSNNTDIVNEPNTYSSDYDYIREDQYSTIQSDTKNGCTNNDTRYPQHNKSLLPEPKHQTEQDSYYTSLDKSASNNVYDELENSKKQDKDPHPRCNDPYTVDFEIKY